MRLHLSLSVAVCFAAFPCVARAQVPAPPTPALQPQTGAVITVPLDRVVANVGEVVITLSNLQERVIQKRQQGVQVPDDSTGFRAFALLVVNELIEEQLLTDKAKSLDIVVPDADVSATVDKQYKETRKRFGSETEFRAELSKAGYGTPEEYRRFMLEEIKRNETITRTIKKLKEDGKIVNANVTDEEVAEAYERNKATLPKREASVTWRQIIIAPKPTEAARVRARAKAESLLVALKGGTNFENLAKRESMDPGSKDKGGDLDWNRRGQMVPLFDRWMFALPPGELSPVVETAFGYHIIRVDRKEPDRVRARHILISPVIDSNDVARARLEADSVAKAWKAGAPFDSLAKKHHDYASGEDAIILTPYPRTQLPVAYQAAFKDKGAKDMVIFQIAGNQYVPAKLVVAQIASAEEGGDLTLAEVKERFRQRLAEEGGVKRLMDQLRKAAYVSVRLDALDLVAPPPAAAPVPSKP